MELASLIEDLGKACGLELTLDEGRCTCLLYTSKWKIHPVTSILVATIILAISIGTPWDKIEGIINKGMADTLKSIAIVIVLGCILGKVLEETGAAVSITKATVKLFGEKRVLWAIPVSYTHLDVYKRQGMG